MPRGFTKEEKKLIKENLIAQATEIFGNFGLKKTNVEDLTNAVGIAKGSFYSFYDSKEELFLEVLKNTEKKFIKEMRNLLDEMQENPKETFKKFLRFHIQAPKENPIIRQIADKNTREYLIRKLHTNPKFQQALQTYEYIPQFIEMWQKSGIVIDKDPELLAGILKSIFTIGLDDEFVEYIGKEKFPEIIEYLIEIITDHMIK